MAPSPNLPHQQDAERDTRPCRESARACCPAAAAPARARAWENPGAAVVGGVVAHGNALAGALSPDQEAAKAKEAEAAAAEKEAQDLQRMADEAKARADAARASVK